MEKLRRIAAFWPGFSELWNNGAPASLVLALLFALSINSAILCSFVWTEFATVGVEVLLWTVPTLCFVVATTYSFICSRGQVALRENAQDLFLRAQREYLGGDWSEAEQLLSHIVKRQPGDIEAQLFLATIYRHTKRVDEARGQLRRISKLTSSNNWAMEIAREWQQLTRQAKQQEPSEVDSPGVKQTATSARAA